MNVACKSYLNLNERKIEMLTIFFQKEKCACNIFYVKRTFDRHLALVPWLLCIVYFCTQSVISLLTFIHIDNELNLENVDFRFRKW